MKEVVSLNLKFEDLGVLRRAALGLLPNVKDPEGHKPITLSKLKSSRNYQFIDDYTATLSGGYRLCRSSRRIPLTKKFYWEFTFLEQSQEGSHVRFGISTTKADMEGPIGVDKYGYSVRDLGGSYHEGHRNAKVKTPPFKIGDVIGIGFVPGEKSISLEMFINGSNECTVFDDIEISNNWIPSFSSFKNAIVKACFQRPFSFDPGDKWSAFSDIPPDNDEGLIEPQFLIDSMKGTLKCDPYDKDFFIEAMDAALIPPHLMPI